MKILENCMKYLFITFKERKAGCGFISIIIVDFFFTCLVAMNRAGTRKNISIYSALLRLPVFELPGKTIAGDSPVFLRNYSTHAPQNRAKIGTE